MVQDLIMNNSQYVEITNVDIRHETDSAVLIAKDGEQYWIPFSQVGVIHRHKNVGQSSIEMTQWIANQKGFI
jgi:hypothetical protein